MLEKLKRAGADTVVSPNFIGGMRIASEMVRPQVVRFLDNMLRDTNTMRVEEVCIPKGSQIVTKTLAETALRQRLNVSVLAVEAADSNDYIYNPGGDSRLEEGMTLVVLGPVAQVDKLREIVHGCEPQLKQFQRFIGDRAGAQVMLPLEGAPP